MVDLESDGLVGMTALNADRVDKRMLPETTEAVNEQRGPECPVPGWQAAPSEVDILSGQRLRGVR